MVACIAGEKEVDMILKISKDSIQMYHLVSVVYYETTHVTHFE